MHSTHAAAKFPVTDWRLISAVRRDEAAQQAATHELCLRYWSPVYAFIRKRGHSTEDARDLTQEFFAQFLEKAQFGKAEAARGRLRTFLLTAVGRFLSNARSRDQSWKRGGRVELASLEAMMETRGGDVPLAADATIPEAALDRAWAVGILDRAMAGLQADMVERGQAELFQRLRGHLSGSGGEALNELASEVSMTAVALRKLVSRMRARLREQVREEIRRTVDSADDVEAELEELKRALLAR